MNRLFFLLLVVCQPSLAAERPNILFAISDDQSYPYASAYGCSGVSTPAFDRVAREGVLFENAFVPSPGCSPTRASILTGRYPWQNEHAGTHASSFTNQLTTYPLRFQAAGYHVGYTGKGWGVASIMSFARCLRLGRWVTDPFDRICRTKVVD